MGLFHDTCTALVDAISGEQLDGEELIEAKSQCLATSKTSGVLSNGKQWRVCGNKVSKKARTCSMCGHRAPGGYIKCPVCHEWIGNESSFCPHCNTRIFVDERPNFVGGIWQHDAGVFAQRFEIEDAAKILKQGIFVQEGSVAILLEGGKYDSVLGPGRHDLDTMAHKINWFGNPPPRSVIVADSGDIVLKVDFNGLRAADESPLRMVAEVTIRFAPSRANDFINNFFKDARSISYEAVCEWLKNETLYAAQNLCTRTTLEDLVKDPNRRTMFEDELSRVIRGLADRTGIDFIRVGFIDFVSPEYDELRSKYAELENRRRFFEFDKKVMELVADNEFAKYADDKGRIERDNEHAEFRAKKEQEIFEYIEQLAQEKELGEMDRKKEIEIVKRRIAGDISNEEALQRLARLQESHNEAMLKLNNNNEYALAQANFSREEEIRKAEHKATLNAIDRSEKQKDAESNAIIYGTQVVNKAKYDAEAESYRTKQTIAQQDARRTIIDTDIDEAKKWVEVRQAKENVGLNSEERRAEIKSKQETERARAVKGLSAIELAAFGDSEESRKAFLDIAALSMKKDMTPEQLLALNAANSDASANALKAALEANGVAPQSLLNELKALYNNSLGRDDKMNERYAVLIERLSGMMSNTASVAAQRVDLAPSVPPSTQQIFK